MAQHFYSIITQVVSRKFKVSCIPILRSVWRTEVPMASRNHRDVLPSSIIPTLQSYSQLSTLYSYVNGSTKLYNLLASATNFTFLAPTNDAFTSWNSSNGNVTSADAIEAALSYHLLNGSWPTADFSSTPQFAPTNLNNASYSNVTIAPAGQRVEVITGSSGDPEFVSSNKNVTSIVTKVFLKPSFRRLETNMNRILFVSMG